MKTAREISAELIPHTTSCHNVCVIYDAIKEARREALEEAMKIALDHIETSNVVAERIANAIRNLIERDRK